MRLLVLALLSAAAVAAQPAPLDAVADALGGADRIDAVQTVRIESRTRGVLGDTRVLIASTFDLALPDAARWSLRFPGTEQTTWIDGSGASTVVGDSTQALSEAARAQVESALWLHPLVLAARRDELTAEALADDLIRVTVPGRREALLVGLNDDGQPSRITTFRRREGRRDYVEVVLRDYRAVDGVFVPHRIRQAVRGAVTGEQTVQSVQFGVDLTGAPFRDGAD